MSEDEHAALTRDDREVRWGGLGEGWESVEAALALIQADLSRTVVGAPTLGFAWYIEDGERTLFVGKGLDWYQGMTPLYLEGEDVASVTVLIADALQDAIVDGLLGPRTFCPSARHTASSLTPCASVPMRGCVPIRSCPRRSR